jgi:hypothetical protein
VENALGVDVVNGFEEFVHVHFNFIWLKVFIAHQTFVEVLFHEFEDECEFAWIGGVVPVG